MPTTPVLALPYPALTDSPDVPYWMQQLAQTIEAKLTNLPRCKLLAAAAQSIPNNITTTVDFAGGTVVYDTAAMADIANDQIVIKRAGYYRLSARIVYNTSATGYRTVVVQKNGADFVFDDYRTAPASPAPAILTATSEPILFALNDTLRLMTAQTSGGALNLAAANGAGRYSHLSVDWVAGQ